MMFISLGMWRGQFQMAIMIGMLLFCILITLLNTTIVYKARIRKYAIKLQKYIEQKEAIIQELEQALRQDMLKENEELYREVVNKLKDREEKLKKEVRRSIAEYYADSGISTDISS